MKYDVFICHASEDKKGFVKPLADALVKENLKVWYDEFELTLGDSLREKIDYGLANSRYGVVILSPEFFAKKWPKEELDGLVARQTSEGKKVILPIWHKVNYEDVKKFSPMLAGKFAARSEEGLEAAVAQIVAACKEETPSKRVPVSQTSEQIPKWISNLSLDIYNIIQQYNAIPRFQEMVREWAKAHQREINKQREWKEKRRQHFEENVATEPRLKDKESGPPGDDWLWQTHVFHPYKETESGLQRTNKMISAWVLPQLSLSAKPEITHLLPLNRDHELTLIEKYTVLAAIYDYGRMGTAKLPPWQWPDLSLEQSQEALSDAKKCVFFEVLCHKASELNTNDEGWLRALLNDVETDVRNWSGLESPELKENIQTIPSETRTGKCIKKIQNLPVISKLIIFGIIVIGIATFITSTEKIINFLRNFLPQDKMQTVSEDPNKISREKPILWRDSNMPRRTNEFQSLITRIQAALHGKRATVKESAMVYNYDTEAETELDILVTFDLGGTSYKTAIECRDHNRSAGPEWIAELKAKRDGCRIDKIIAVHSKGFTESALTSAEKYAIETVTPHKDLLVDWGQKMLPYEVLSFQTCQCAIPEGLKFDMVGNPPTKVESASSYIIFPNETRINASAFVDKTIELIRNYYSNMYDLTGTQGSSIKPREIGKTIDLTMRFPPGTIVQPTEGENLIVNSASAVCLIKIKTIVIDTLEYLSLGDSSRATYANFEFLGRKSNITLTEQKGKPNELGICLYMEGITISGESGPKLIYGTEKSDVNSIKIYLKER